ncbi:MAG: hypothetical protein N2036_10135 [Bryobacteraceae bacterium]|nr:hypothetical protein [Bryobacteraceae bacterium]
MNRAEFLSVLALGAVKKPAFSGTRMHWQNAQTRDFRLLTLPGGKTAMPTWHYGLLVFLHFPGDGSPHFTVIDPEADRIFARVTAQAPEAEEVFPIDLAVFPDRKRFVISAVTRNVKGTRSLWLLFLSSGGQPLHAEKVTPFRPARLAVAPDETVWALGDDVRAGGSPDSTSPVLWHWSSGGQLLHRVLERRLFPQTGPLGEALPPHGDPGLAVSSDRVAVYAPASGVLAEVNPRGEILDIHRPAVPTAPDGSPLSFLGLAVLDRGEIFGAVGGIRRFDRVGGRWSDPETSGALGHGRILFGGFGRQLLINGASGDRFHYRLVTLP